MEIALQVLTNQTRAKANLHLKVTNRVQNGWFTYQAMQEVPIISTILKAFESKVTWLNQSAKCLYDAFEVVDALEALSMSGLFG